MAELAHGVLDSKVDMIMLEEAALLKSMSGKTGSVSAIPIQSITVGSANGTHN